MPERKNQLRSCSRGRQFCIWITVTARLKSALARQACALLAMDSIDMTFDLAPIRQAFPDLRNTYMPTALEELLA